MTTPGPAPSSPDDQPALPRELMLFLVQLSAALNKSRAYPPGHPVLGAAMELLVQQLFVLLRQRPALTLGVTRDRLLIEGTVTDPGHGILRDLAGRLHRHQLAALQIRPGVLQEELADLLQALAAETWRQAKPLGLDPQEELAARWPHITLEPIPLDQLELGEEGGATPEARGADRFWQGLVNAALLQARDAAAEPGTGPAPVAHVAQAIRSRRGDAAYDKAIVAWLLQAGERLGEAGTPVRKMVSELFGQLDQETLQNLLSLGATVEERRDLLFKGARALPVRAVLDLLEATGATSGQNLSHSLLRILSKLAAHAETARGPIVPGAEEVVRDSVRQLVGEWGGIETEAHHRQLLDLLARPGEADGGPGGRATAGALRVIQMGLELRVEAPAVTLALRAVRESGDLETLLDLHERGQAAGLRVAPLWQALTATDFLRDRLLDEAQDPAPVGRVLDAMGEASAGPLLDAMELSDSASRRKWILGRLERFGARLGPLLVERLPGKPWYVVRNLLSLVDTLPESPPGFNGMPYLEHDDPRVRRTAFKLLAGQPGSRTPAILRALSDPDPGLVMLALGAAAEDCPAEVPPRVLELLRGHWPDPEVRVAAIRLLGKRPTGAARGWLLAQVVTERGWLWFRRKRLQPKSPEMLAALGALAHGYSVQGEVAAVCRLAAQSPDPEVRKAAKAGGR